MTCSTAAGDKQPFGAKWVAAVSLILETMVEEQKSSEQSPEPAYNFMRSTSQVSHTYHKQIVCATF